jgi:O-antigen/teichoic acid export membrane protein
MTADEAVLRRIRTRSVAAGAILSSAAFLVGWRAGVSLTISAAVVIFSFLVFEKLTERLAVPQGRAGSTRVLSLLLVTGAGVTLLVVVLRWEGFVPVAGFVGLSAVVLAIVAEIFEGSGES